jgi:hypothetical protein
MNIRHAFCIAAASGMLSACAMPQSATGPAASPAQRSAVLPNSKSGDALIFAGIKRYVEVYSFPDGAYQSKFTIKGAIAGMCSDSGGNVFIAAGPRVASANGTGTVYEYAHDSSPVADLGVPAHEVPVACSSDPTTGNLAVSAQNSRNFAPEILIYSNASGSPAVYASSALGANPQLAYDDRGNLFATSGSNVGAELAAGSNSFATITFAKTLGPVAHVQWDGTYWALQSLDASKHNGEKIFERIFRLQISGSVAKLAGFTRFAGWPAKDPGQSWIQGSTILGTPYSDIDFWNYPAGGKPVKTVHSAQPVKAITVSTSG